MCVLKFFMQNNKSIVYDNSKKRSEKYILMSPLIVIVYIVINFTRQTQHTQYLSLLAQRQFVFLFLYGNQSDTLDRKCSLFFWCSLNLHKKAYAILRIVILVIACRLSFGPEKHMTLY